MCEYKEADASWSDELVIVDEVKYIEVPWDTPPPSPVNCPKEIATLAAELQKAVEKVDVVLTVPPKVVHKLPRRRRQTGGL